MTWTLDIYKTITRRGQTYAWRLIAGTLKETRKQLHHNNVQSHELTDHDLPPRKIALARFKRFMKKKGLEE